MTYTRKIKDFSKTVLRRRSILWSLFMVRTRLSSAIKACQRGLLAFEEKSSYSAESNFRRNIHRIEKGFTYQSRRKVFASKYILETVLFLKDHGSKMDPLTVAWGTAVLALYFKEVEVSGEIETASTIFRNININNISPEKVPYKSHQREFSSISYNDLHALAKRRRSVRQYLDKRVEYADIQKAAVIALQAPSACNRQSFKFKFYNDEEIVQKITQLPGGVHGYSVPSVVVIVAKYSGYFDERDFFAPFIDSSHASMGFQFALETIGLASVCINWPQLKKLDTKIRSVISLEEDEVVVMLLGVGYPDPEGMIPYSGKKDATTIVQNCSA